MDARPDRAFLQQDYAVKTTDYDPTPPGPERDRTFRLFHRMFAGVPIALDFGDGDVRPLSDEPPLVLLAPPRFRTLLSILVNPGLRLGEAFMDGKWYVSEGTVFDLLFLFVTAKGGERRKQGLTFGLSEIITHYYKQFLATFSATREVARHYDVNTELYRHMIGPNLVYSCAFFEDGITDLDDAQQRKFDTIFRRMRLDEVDRVKVLDIGCGWGSFERYFPADLKGEVDAISISQGQIDWATAHVQEIAGGKDLTVRFRKEDYRTFCTRHAGEYNRVVSIGMLEHVGRSKYGHYFSAINDVLTADGLALIHSIVKHQPSRTNLWIDRYIFPGGYIPKVSEVIQGVEAAGLRTHAFHFHRGIHYKTTLQHWLRNLLAHEAEILEILESDEGGKAHSARVVRSTYRMFIYYLSAVQLMFDERYSDIGVGHFIVAR